LPKKADPSPNRKERGRGNKMQNSTTNNQCSPKELKKRRGKKGRRLKKDFLAGKREVGWTEKTGKKKTSGRKTTTRKTEPIEL